jgi:hypothetical protein
VGGELALTEFTLPAMGVGFGQGPRLFVRIEENSLTLATSSNYGGKNQGAEKH